MSVIVITGANKGIGLELTKIYANQGDTVYACCRNPDTAEELNALAQQQDVNIVEVQVGEDASVDALATTLGKTAIDLLINNAGTPGPAFDKQTATSMDFAGWAETMNINTMAPVRVMHALMQNLKSSGDAKVVSITSQMGALALDMPVAYAYSTSKAALNKYMKMAALELAKENIGIAVIHPGWVQTDMGGPGADITPLESATGIADVISKLDTSNNGSFWKWDGEKHAW